MPRKISGIHLTLRENEAWSIPISQQEDLMWALEKKYIDWIQLLGFVKTT